MRFELSGILPALLTPFTRGGTKVDYEKACAFASTLADRGVDGIFVCGSTGEGLLMTIEERKQLAEEIIGAVGKRVKVLVQTGCLDTGGTIALTRHARDAGAFAVAVYTPSFYIYDHRALFGHFQRVAKAVPEMPLLLYNIPRFTGNTLSPDLIIELAEKVDSVVGVKDSSGDLSQLSRVVATAPKGFIMLNGADELNYQAYLTGAVGSVTMTGNVVPELFISIFNSVKEGDFKRALKDQRKLAEVKVSLANGRLIAAYKEAIRLQGYDVGHVRPPHRELSPSEKKDLAKVLGKIGLI